MKHRKPDPTNKLVFPKLDANDQTREYNESKHVSVPSRSRFIYCVPFSNNVNLGKKLRGYVRATQYLKEVKKTEVVRRKQMDANWEDLERKQNDLREVVIKFDEFVTNNAEKRERTQQKIVDEQNLYMQRCRDIDMLHKKMDTFLYIKGRREEQIKIYRKYEYFLDTVATYNRDFKSIYQVLTRYESLQDSKKEILNQQNLILDELERVKRELLEMIAKKMMILMRLTVTFSDLQNRYGLAKRRALEWETILAAIKEKTVKMNSDVENVKICCDAIYKLMCERRGVEVDPNATLEEKFFFIKRALGNYKKIVQAAPGTKVRKKKQVQVKVTAKNLKKN